MNVEIDLLGGFAVRVDGRPIPATEWRRRQAASLVKLLALAPRRTLHREQMIDALWPGASSTSPARGFICGALCPSFAGRLKRAPHFVTMGTTEMNWRPNAGHDPNHLAEPPRFNTEPVTIRVTNGSGKTVDLVGTATVTYGPDGQEAKTSYVDDQDIAEGLGSESFARPTDPSDPPG